MGKTGFEESATTMLDTYFDSEFIVNRLVTLRMLKLKLLCVKRQIGQKCPCSVKYIFSKHFGALRLSLKVGFSKF